jgi:hypothetical protein
MLDVKLEKCFACINVTCLNSASYFLINRFEYVHIALLLLPSTQSREGALQTNLNHCKKMQLTLGNKPEYIDAPI